MSLEQYRKKIDEIDNQIVTLVSDRIKLVQEVAEFKKTNNLPLVDKVREEEILTKKIEQARKLGLNQTFIKRLIEDTITEGKKNF